MSARLLKMSSNSKSLAIIATFKRYLSATTNLYVAGDKPTSSGGEATKTKGNQAPHKKEVEQEKKPKVAKKEGEQEKKPKASKKEGEQDKKSAKPEEKASEKKPASKK